MDEALKINCQRAFKEIVDALIDLEEYFTIEDMDANKIKYNIELVMGGSTITFNYDYTTVLLTEKFYNGWDRIHCFYFNDPDWIAKFINKIWEMQDARNSGN